ncbi:MAG: hypothetical protein RLY86_4374 [Pseudomonadota bacterium]|jgi:hypothetical protein
MSDRPDPDLPPALATRHITARIPEVLAAQVEIVKAKRGLRHFSEALVYTLDRGLDAIARLDRKPDRLEAMVARTEDLTVTIVAILNHLHDLDPAAVAAMRDRVLESLDDRRRVGVAIPDATGLGFAPLNGTGSGTRGRGR